MVTSYEEIKKEIHELESEFPENTYLLYAMGLKLRTMDYSSLLDEYVLDNPDDKKIDFFCMDTDEGTAIIVQSYYSTDWAKKEAPSNKASDLNTAINWLLKSDIDTIDRTDIRASAEQLRDGLTNGEITRVEVYYLHNLKKSINIEKELGTVKRSLDAHLSNYEGTIDILVQQASIEIVDGWRLSQHEAISINDSIEIESTIDPQKLESTEWKAVIAAVPAKQIVDLRTKYGDKLSSANVRDYLGSRKSARNINRQIEKTAQEEPKNFWIYNNGITLVTNKISIDGKKLTLSGGAIINGAQTTGSLA